MHGYTFLLLTPFSFVKLLWKNDWWVATVLKNIESAPGKPFLKVHNPTTSHPFPTSLQKSWIGPRTLKTAPRALDISGNYWIKRKQNLITKKIPRWKELEDTIWIYRIRKTLFKNTVSSLKDSRFPSRMILIPTSALFTSVKLYKFSLEIKN